MSPARNHSSLRTHFAGPSTKSAGEFVVKEHCPTPCWYRKACMNTSQSQLNLSRIAMCTPQKYSGLLSYSAASSRFCSTASGAGACAFRRLTAPVWDGIAASTYWTGNSRTYFPACSIQLLSGSTQSAVPISCRGIPDHYNGWRTSYAPSWSYSRCGSTSWSSPSRYTCGRVLNRVVPRSPVHATGTDNSQVRRRTANVCITRIIASSL